MISLADEVSLGTKARLRSKIVDRSSAINKANYRLAKFAYLQYGGRS